ncbi:[FeFe] hydrogenase H-cluster radical SAM maturase HydG [Candidatus Woesearchaeota archaeon]|nr:[FeFe] hydrogenase H-cluster radical SAM maturase HydG [Candidatus Woesearchaeota archaeon]
MQNVKDIVDEEKFYNLLERTRNPSAGKILKILEKAKEKKGLTIEEIGFLLNTTDEKLIPLMFDAAGKIKKEIYGERLVFFAPLYASSFCVNDCEYCGFHSRNKEPRKKLALKEIEEQVNLLIEMGHKRLLVEFGEDPKENPIDYVVDVIKTIYNTKSHCKNTDDGNTINGNLINSNLITGEIRRVNVNIAATSVENYKKLKSAGIGTYQLFQETYHKETYKNLHHGPKADYERQLFAHNRAFEAGIDDLGIGVLFGLYDYKFEVLGLVSHAQYMEKTFGVGPHTISVPRWQPAKGVDWGRPPYYVSDDELLKIISILRMGVPYTGMIISTRERPEIRAKAFEIGISQTSAASRTSPGGYGSGEKLTQFNIADNRPVDEVIKSVLIQGLLPSFCTACYRNSRTGDAFMALAKTGDIQNLCRPNALLTFKEYLKDYAAPDVKKLGLTVLNTYLNEISDENRKKETIARLKRIENGERDLYF